ncbi:MAG: replication protein RepA [Gemmataceae bacterium]
MMEIRYVIDNEDLTTKDLSFLHTVLAVCGLPYRRPSGDAREYLREQGRNSLVVQAGFLKDPTSGRMVPPQGLPYGPKARLLLIHICTEALRQNNREIAIADSMSAFIRDLGFAVTGGARGTIPQFKEQLNRLAAAHMQIGLWDGSNATTVATQPIKQFQVWFPRTPEQKILWPSVITLDHDFFISLREHGLPIDGRRLQGLTGSALKIDLFLWLSHRLRRVAKPTVIPWARLQEQFGQDYAEPRFFRREFVKALKDVLDVYPDARLSLDEDGLTLKPSPSPVADYTPRRSLK